MSDVLEIFGFETSNNMKVRVALGFKGIPYRWHQVDPGERSEVQRLTRQPLTPALRHGGVALFDSGAILRYLEANFPDAPPLFSHDYDAMRAIEQWESFARGSLLEPMLSVVLARRAGADETPVATRAAADLAQAVATLERELADREWLVDGRLTAADVVTAAIVHRVRSSGILPLPDGIDRVLGWVDRVMVHDGASR